MYIGREKTMAMFLLIYSVLLITTNIVNNVHAEVPTVLSNVLLSYQSNTGATIIQIDPPPLALENIVDYDISYSKEDVGMNGYWLNRKHFTCTSKNRLNDKTRCSNVLDDNSETIWENNGNLPLNYLQTQQNHIAFDMKQRYVINKIQNVGLGHES